MLILIRLYELFGSILALIAFTEIRALEARVVALTVLFDAFRLFAVTALLSQLLNLPLFLFGQKGIRVSIQRLLNGSVSVFRVCASILAVLTVARVLAETLVGEAFAVQFETLRFLAVAAHQSDCFQLLFRSHHRRGG